MLAVRTTRFFDGERFGDGEVTVLVDKGRITAVEQGFPVLSESWQVLDYGDATVLPGLIDTHSHLVTDGGLRALDRVAGYSDDDIDAVITAGLGRHLDAGETTVRDLGDRDFTVLERRNRQRSGVAASEPTILASGPPLTSPGGHCFYMGGEVAGRDAIIAAVKERAERRADVVKVMASGGMNTPGTDVMRTQFSTADLRLIVEQSHAAGLPVTAHAHGLPAVEQAVEVGVDGIEHCSCLTDKGIDLSEQLLEKLANSGIAIGGIVPVPPSAMMANAPAAVREQMEKQGLTPERLKAVRLSMVGRAHRAGVRLVAGPDSGIAPFVGHGMLRGLITFFTEAGLSTSASLAAATSAAAEACGVGDRKGLLRSGYDADLVVVDGDLRTDLDALGRVRSVVLGGRLVRTADEMAD